MGRYYTIKGGARGLPVQPVTMDEILEMKQNKNYRLTTSPFGLTEEDIREGRKVLYVGRAVPWKGVKGAQFWEFAENHVNKKGERGTLAAGLKKAIEISKSAAGVTGVGVAPDGRILPAKAIAQMRAAGKL